MMMISMISDEKLFITNGIDQLLNIVIRCQGWISSEPFRDRLQIVKRSSKVADEQKVLTKIDRAESLDVEGDACTRSS